MKIVYLNDSNISYDDAPAHFKKAADWARKHCRSFVSYDIQDVSDFSMQNDYIAMYKFMDFKDADWFSLRWL